MKCQRQLSELSAVRNFSHLAIYAYDLDKGSNLFQILTQDCEFKVDAVSLTPLNKKSMYNIKIPSVERGLVLHFAGDYKLHF